MLGVVLVGIDVASRLLAEQWLSKQVRAATGATSVSATLNDVPFLPPLLFSGSIAHVKVVAFGVPAGRFTIERVSVEATGTRLDRKLLFADQTVKPTAISSARITVEVSGAELSKALGYPISLKQDGQATVVVRGQRLPASARIVAGHLLVVDVAGTAVATVDLSRSPLVPSCPMTMAISHATLSLGCRITPVPTSLLRALSD